MNIDHTDKDDVEDGRKVRQEGEGGYENRYKCIECSVAAGEQNTD